MSAASKFLSVLISAILFAAFLSVPVKCESSEPVYSYVLMEGSTSTLLYSENGSAVLPAHHSAKLMTLLLVCEAMDGGLLTLDTVLKTSAHANSMQGAQIWLSVGETVPVSELISAITVGNANDACVLLAEGVAGSEEKFVEKMNARARDLGMMNTFYADCTGISPETVTTACDCAVLASKLTGYIWLREYLTTWTTSVRDGKTQLASTNRLILSYDGIIGTKAYYSEALGNCVIASAERDGLIMVVVIFGEKDEFQRFTTAKEKLNAGFGAYMMYKPRTSDIYTEPVRVKKGEMSEVETSLNALKSFVIRKSQADSVKTAVEYYSDIEAPIEPGDEVGRVIYTVDGEEIYSCPIAASNRVRRINIFIAVKRTLKSLVLM